MQRMLGTRIHWQISKFKEDLIKLRQLKKKERNLSGNYTQY